MELYLSLFTEQLVVTPLSDGRTWVILRPFGYDVGNVGSGDTVKVKTGFMTDFASIPRLLWIFLPCWGKYGNAAVIHDWLYWAQKRSRKEADGIMLEGMKVLKVPCWQKYPIYMAVRLFGQMAWKRNQWDRDAGFKRVLISYRLKTGDESNRPSLISRTLEHFRNRSS